MITSELFGTAPCGTPVHRYTLNGPEICVRIMDYGATVLGIDVPDIPGNVPAMVIVAPAVRFATGPMVAPKQAGLSK